MKGAEMELTTGIAKLVDSWAFQLSSIADRIRMIDVQKVNGTTSQDELISELIKAQLISQFMDGRFQLAVLRHYPDGIDPINGRKLNNLIEKDLNEKIQSIQAVAIEIFGEENA